MVPIDHARLHARDFGGLPEDYIEIDKFLDATKFQFTDFRHRAILHNPFGISLVESCFGDTITNSDMVDVPVREIARRHIVQDCGCVPTTKEWIDAIADGTVGKFNKPSKKDMAWLKEYYYEQEETIF